MKRKTNVLKDYMIRMKGEMCVMEWFLVFIIGGFLLGCAAIITTIILVMAICGCLGGCASIHKRVCDQLGKLMRQTSQTRNNGLASRTIEA